MSELVAKIDNPAAVEKAPKSDPFADPLKSIKDFEGLSHNFKRRKIAKGVGIEDTGSKQKYLEDSTTNGYGLFDVVTPPYNLVELASLYDNSSANHAAVNAKVANIVGLGYDFEITDAVRQRLEEMDGDQLIRAQRKVDKVKSEVKQWLFTLNDEDTFIHTLEKMYTDVETTGNGYLEIGRTVTGEIGYIGHIPSITMRVRRSRDGFVQLVMNKVTYFKNFRGENHNPLTSDPRPNEIIHIKKYSPRNTYYGVPDAVAAAIPIVGNELAGKYNVDYFENKAVPRYIITVKGASLSPESEEKLFRFLQTGLRGQNHRTLLVPLPGDTPESKVEFEMKAIENQILDASFLDYRKENTNETLMSHGVPRSRVGGASDQVLAAALSADRTFKEAVARPAQDRLEKVINRVIREKTDILAFQFKELSLTDEIAQSQIDERYIRNNVITPNEIRPRLGLPTRDDAQDFVNPTAKQQLKADQQKAEATAQAAATRQRDQQRTANNSDSPSTVSGRNAKGEGRKQP